MATKRNEVIGYLHTNGYRFVSASRNGYDVYRGPRGHEIKLHSTPSEADIAEVKRTVARALGITGPKRSTTKARSRAKAKADRERAVQAKRRAQTAAILADKEAAMTERSEARRISDASLGGLGKNLTNREARDVSRRLEDTARGHRQVVALMTSVPDRSVRGDIGG